MLVVEDDADVRNYSCETLRELGYSVLEAENGAAALQYWTAILRYVLLFTDVGLPGGMNGRQLVGGSAKAAARLEGALYDRLCPKCDCS